ncbi:MAG: hypothetical protein K2P94_00980 [Rhodospirillaceae bacterium]|nr:hypothetical protein [Rhodospirillaceae bacterium]
MRIIGAALLGALMALPVQPATAKPDYLGTQATPQGITVSPPRSVDMGNRRRGGNIPNSVLSDSAGMTLYVRESEEACVDECAKQWPPLAAPAKAKAEGDWSVVTRPDGARQWAYKGKALYRSVMDTKPGETKGDAADGVWKTAVYEVPGKDLLTPAGITVKPNVRAGGEVFVDFRGMTLYTSADKNDACRKDCLASWKPLLAGELAKPVGDWTISEREDGTRQWTYKSRGVYTFNGDERSGDAHGVLFDPRWQAATVRRYFVPPQVQLRKSGSVLTFTTANGLTLYARDKYVYAPGSFHANDGSLSNITTGRDIGIGGCDGACDAEWVPFKAAADAQPSGYWSILTRPDGTRQWAYQGYALYTNTKDKKPGEMYGRDVFNFTDGSKAMYWRIAHP